MLIHQKYIYGQKNTLKEPNTFIGGIGGVITNKTLLAEKLSVSANEINNFTITNNNISCNIDVNYSVLAYSFSTNSLHDSIWGYGALLTYFLVDDKCVSAGSFSFYGQTNMLSFRADNLTGIGHRCFYESMINEAYFPNNNILGRGTSAFCFRNNINLKNIYLPNCTQYGSANVSSIYTDRALIDIINLENIYVHPSMMTINAGGLEANLQVAQNKGATIIPVTSTVPPEAIDNLTASNITVNSVDLNFTAPTSVNGIMRYDVFVDDGTNDALKLYTPTKNITASGQTLTGLSSGVTYIIKTRARNTFFTHGEFSNEITITTL